MSWLKHAFAIDSSGPAVPTESQRIVVDRVCAEVNRRHLTTPALLFLESVRPLNYVGSQAMHFFQPIVSVVLRSGESYQHFAEFLERRGSVDYICERLERLQKQATKKRAPAGKPGPGASQPEGTPDHP